jgi:hypothetical protein
MIVKTPAWRGTHAGRGGDFDTSQIGRNAENDGMVAEQYSASTERDPSRTRLVSGGAEMIPTTKALLSKQRIGDIIKRIRAGDSIEPEGSVWTLVDCVTVAGVLLSSAQATAAAYGGSTPAISGATPQQTLQKLQEAIEFIAAMANAHSNGTWDEYFENVVTIGLGDGGLRSLQGFKK